MQARAAVRRIRFFEPADPQNGFFVFALNYGTEPQFQFAARFEKTNFARSLF